jgi:hypothetical protein
MSWIPCGLFLLLFFFFFFRTQGLVLVRQVPYHVSHTSSPGSDALNGTCQLCDLGQALGFLELLLEQASHKAAFMLPLCMILCYVEMRIEADRNSLV